MVAGGGASVIYADTVCSHLFILFPLLVHSTFKFLMQVGDLGYASELGNYAEYSGAPKEDEVLQYARVVIDVIFSLFFPPYIRLFLSCD